MRISVGSNSEENIDVLKKSLIKVSGSNILQELAKTDRRVLDGPFMSKLDVNRS